MQQVLIHVIPLFFALYAYSSLFARTRLHWAIKGLSIFFIFFASQYPAFCRSFFAGHDQSVPHLGIILWSWLFASQIFLIVLAFLKDAYQHLMKWLCHRAAVPHATTAVTLCTLAMFLGAYGTYSALKQPQIRYVTVPVENLSPDLEGFRIVQLSDIHASALLDRSRLEKIVQTTNSLNPDLIAVTGDIVDGRVEVRKQDVMPLAQLHARHGVYAVEGNHDHYVDYDGWMKALPRLGLSVLHNSHVVLQVNGSPLIIAGLTDPMAKRYGRDLPDIRKALDGTQGLGAPIILLSHQPKHSREFLGYHINLQLSGHTHGGQIFGMHWLAQALNDGFVKGAYQLGPTMVYVNRGTGLWYGFPIRLGILGEITVFTLTSSAKNP